MKTVRPDDLLTFAIARTAGDPQYAYRSLDWWHDWVAKRLMPMYRGAHGNDYGCTQKTFVRVSRHLMFWHDRDNSDRASYESENLNWERE